MDIFLLTPIFLVCVNTQCCCDLRHHKPLPEEEDVQVQDLLVLVPDPLRPHHLQGGLSTQEDRPDLWIPKHPHLCAYQGRLQVCLTLYVSTAARTSSTRKWTLMTLLQMLPNIEAVLLLRMLLKPPPRLLPNLIVKMLWNPLLQLGLLMFFNFR